MPPPVGWRTPPPVDAERLNGGAGSERAGERDPTRSPFDLAFGSPSPSHCYQRIRFVPSRPRYISFPAGLAGPLDPRSALPASLQSSSVHLEALPASLPDAADVRSALPASLANPAAAFVALPARCLRWVPLSRALPASPENQDLDTSSLPASRGNHGRNTFPCQQGICPDGWQQLPQGHPELIPSDAHRSTCNLPKKQSSHRSNS